MSVTTQHKRGTTVNHASYTGPQGEFTYNTTEKRIVAQDGETAGGVPTAKKSEVDAVSQRVDQVEAAAFTRAQLHAIALLF